MNRSPESLGSSPSTSSTASPASPNDGLARNALSLTELIFTALATLAPLTLVVAVMPLHFFVGGSAVPGGYLVAAIVMALFSVGLTTMMRYVRNTGAFYAIITRGLGREVGSAAALLAVIAYNALQVSTYGALGLYVGDTVGRFFGIEAPWWLYAAVALAAVAFLGYRGITASAKILTVVLACEITVLIVLAVSIFVSSGGDALSLEPVAPSVVFTFENGAMFGLIFGAFMGFESTVIYSEEVKGGVKTVRRATYAVVAFIGVFYAIMAYAIVTAYGVENIEEAAAADTAGLALSLFEKHTPAWLVDVTLVLLLLSAFAALLALHNASNRYLYALGREGLLPAKFGSVHPRTRSPWVAGTAQSLFALVVLVLCVVLNIDPYLGLLLWGSALGFLGIIGLWALCSLAVVVYLRREHPEAGLWRTTIAPSISFVALSLVLVLVVANFDLFSGGAPFVNEILIGLAVIAVVVGIARALYLRTRSPERYARLGSVNVADENDLPEHDRVAALGN
ncbi:APC family permease [Microbacterium tenebrionis]|uniref:APC family permease n=1 Tax=Microbacterium tenebrionis TaxID=2830665 RepID=UPI00158AE664|nr:APC family permease [Microbacterium ihumii]